MGLCGGFSLLLKRPELMLNEFFDDIFSESPFFRFFSGVIYTKKSECFPMIFKIKNRVCDEKKQFFYERGAGTWNLE